MQPFNVTIQCYTTLFVHAIRHAAPLLPTQHTCKRHNHAGVVALALQLLHPRLRAPERLNTCDVVDNDRGGGAAVVHWSKAVVALLASGVPASAGERVGGMASCGDGASVLCTCYGIVPPCMRFDVKLCNTGG
eukprot:62956-Chlamydomonas_euryale.AAC.5